MEQSFAAESPGDEDAIQRRPHGAPSPAEEVVLVARKKVLLRLLAPLVLEALGLTVPADGAQRLSDTVRRLWGLTGKAEMKAWLDRAGLSPTEFSQLMAEWAACALLEQHFAEEIDRLVPGQLALQSMRDARREPAA